MCDWLMTGDPAVSPGGRYSNPELVFELEPQYGKRKGGKFSISIFPDKLAALHAAIGKALKEIEANETIQDELDQYKEVLDQERAQAVAKKRAELREKAGLEPDQMDVAAMEIERKKALEIVESMKPKQRRR